MANVIPNLDLNPARQAGFAIAGGDPGRVALAEAQGESLGANTAKAVAEAQARIARNKVLADPTLAAQITAGANGVSPQGGTLMATLLRARDGGDSIDDFFKGAQTNQGSGFRETIAGNNPDGTPAAPPPVGDAVAAAAAEERRKHAAQALAPASFASPLVDANGNLIAARTASTLADVPLKGAKTALANEQTAHPELFHPSATGAGPVTEADMDTAARMVHDGLVPVPTGTGLARLGGAKFLARIDAIDHPTAPAAPGAAAPAPVAPSATPFNGSDFATRQAAVKDWNSQNGSGKMVDAVNRVAEHANIMESLIPALGNSTIPLSNKVKNYFTTQFGGAAPNNADEAAQILGTEIVKSMTVTGAGTGEERNALAHQFANAKTPEQLTEALGVARRLVGGQAVALEQRYKTGTGRDDFRSNRLLPSARHALGLDSATPAPAAAAAPGAVDPNDPLGLRTK